jgi:DNA mismatch repair protein MutS2
VERSLRLKTGWLRSKREALGSLFLDKIERISKAELEKSLRSGNIIPESDPLIIRRRLNFKPEIDIRGVRGEEAINQVRDFLDNALMVQHCSLRILHGKGNGILRQLVRSTCQQ